jgi:hypothetical protein
MDTETKCHRTFRYHKISSLLNNFLQPFKNHSQFMCHAKTDSKSDLASGAYVADPWPRGRSWNKLQCLSHDSPPNGMALQSCLNQRWIAPEWVAWCFNARCSWKGEWTWVRQFWSVKNKSQRGTQLRAVIYNISNACLSHRGAQTHDIPTTRPVLTHSTGCLHFDDIKFHHYFPCAIFGSDTQMKLNSI